MRKTLRVHGERTWLRRQGAPGLTPSRAKPFVSMPVCYERAFGGQDPAGGREHFALNPVGIGFANVPEALVDTAVPYVEDPREPLMAADQPPTRAAGFGGISPHWSQRTRFAGTYDATWQRERAPLWPEDFDTRYFQAAPEDQQVPGFLRGGEECSLHQLTPRGLWRFTLPTLQVDVTTRFKAGKEPAARAALHTLIIEPDAQRVTIVYACALECHEREHLLEESRIRWEGNKTWVEEARPSTSTT